MRYGLRHIAIIALSILSACTTAPPKPQTPSNWQQQLQHNMGLNNWRLNGKLAFRSPGESGSASLRWQQQEQQYNMRLSGLFGIGTTYIDGDRQQVTLRRGKEQQVANNSQQLTGSLLGVPLSVEDLTYWVRGIPTPESTSNHLAHNELGTLDSLEQNGWKLEFSRYRRSGNWLLPGKISGTFTSSQGELTFKLVIKNWQPQTTTAPQ